MAPSLIVEDDLTAREREILAFAKTTWRYQGAKEAAIRDLFDCSPTQHYQAVNALIDKPAALAAEPTLVKRLRRLRTERQHRREHPLDTPAAM